MLTNFNMVMAVSLGVLFLWLVFLSVVFYRIFNHYRRLTKGVTAKDLKSVWESLLKELEHGSEKYSSLAKELKTLEKDNLHNIQKIGLVRFNPFAETGGDQSFCLAVLDGNQSGYVISSLHSRDATRVYAKPIRKSVAVGYELSNEEKRAIENAKKIK